MRNYTITINDKDVYVAKASRASVAVHRVLEKFTDGQLDYTTVYIRRGSPVKYAYRIVAEVPCEPAGSTKRDFVSGNIQLRDIPDAMRLVVAEHPEYKFVGYKRVEL
jgi:hypothetical protein